MELSLAAPWGHTKGVDGVNTRRLPHRYRTKQRVMHGGHADNPSVVPRRWINRKWPWRSGCTASGESASTIATTLGVSRATVYRVLAEQDG